MWRQSHKSREYKVQVFFVRDRLRSTSSWLTFPDHLALRISGHRHREAPFLRRARPKCRAVAGKQGPRSARDRREIPHSLPDIQLGIKRRRKKKIPHSPCVHEGGWLIRLSVRESPSATVAGCGLACIRACACRVASCLCTVLRPCVSKNHKSGCHDSASRFSGLADWLAGWLLARWQMFGGRLALPPPAALPAPPFS